MRTGRFAAATLRCAARGEISDDEAIERVLAARPDLHERARRDLAEARRLIATRNGPEVGRASFIIADLLEAAGIPRPRPRQESH
jgi:hypothetical protein